MALVALNRMEQRNNFLGKSEFVEREDLVYSNKTIIEMVRIDT